MLPTIFLIPWLSSIVPIVDGSFCKNMEACSAQISHFPQLEEVGLQVAVSRMSSQEASGWGSGWGSGMLPLYDEFFDGQNSLDYEASPEVSTFSLCDCPNNQTCDSSEDSRNMNLDNSLRLTFCSNIDTHIPIVGCKTKRGIIRVIGPADETGNFISSVASTIVFCSCPTGYHRQSAEVWNGGILAIHYNCV